MDGQSRFFFSFGTDCSVYKSTLCLIWHKVSILKMLAVFIDQFAIVSGGAAAIGTDHYLRRLSSDTVTVSLLLLLLFPSL